MKAEERRKGIALFLLSEKKAVPGNALSKKFGVSRQIIVHDISLLKEQGYDIIATHSGYVIQGSPLCERVFRVRHTESETEGELDLIVGLGGTVADVYVEHEIYGRVEAALNISNQDQIREFMNNVRNGKSSELMNITGGYHYHTVRAETEEILDVIQKALTVRGYILREPKRG